MYYSQIHYIPVFIGKKKTENKLDQKQIVILTRVQMTNNT